MAALQRILFFTMPNGEVRQIAWFVSYLDEESELPGPFQPAFYYQQKDERIDDRSIPAVMNDELSPYFDGERLYPFAALVTNGYSPLNIRMRTIDSYPGDTLCFDQSVQPHCVVLCDGKLATEEVLKWDNSDIEDVTYENYITPVADSFADFVEMLRAEP